MADPEEYRTKEQVEKWRARDPLVTFGDRLVAEGALTETEREEMDAGAMAIVDKAVAFADASPAPAPETLYDDVYVLGNQVRGWWSLDERSPEPHRGEDERDYEQVERDEHATSTTGRSPSSTPSRASTARRPDGRDRPDNRRQDDALPRGAQRGAARGDAARRRGLPDGRGHRRLQRRLQGDCRPARGVR